MSTLTEIEAAVDALPPADQRTLLLRIEAKLPPLIPVEGKLVLENGHAVLAAPRDAPAMTPELVKAMLVDFP